MGGGAVPERHWPVIFFSQGPGLPITDALHLTTSGCEA